MFFNHLKLERTVVFIKNTHRKFNLKLNGVTYIEFTESSRVGGN